MKIVTKSQCQTLTKDEWAGKLPLVSGTCVLAGKLTTGLKQEHVRIGRLC